MPSRGPSYSEFATTPMISIVSFDFGPSPNPIRLPTALLPRKKCSAKCRLTIATVDCSRSSVSLKSRPSSNGIFIVSK